MASLLDCVRRKPGSDDMTPLLRISSRIIAHRWCCRHRQRFPNYVGGAEFGGLLSGFISGVLVARACRSLNLASKLTAGYGGFIGVCDLGCPGRKHRFAARNERQ